MDDLVTVLLELGENAIQRMAVGFLMSWKRMIPLPTCLTRVSTLLATRADVTPGSVSPEITSTDQMLMLRLAR